MRKSFLAAAIIALFAATALYAQPGPGPMMAEELKLTDQQIEQMQALKLQAEKALIPKKADLKLAQLELREIMMKAKVDEKAALAKQEKISSVKAEMAKMRLQNRLAMRKVLTDEQLAQWMKMGHERMSRGRGGKGCCQGMGHMRGQMMGGCGMGQGMGPGMGMEQGPGPKK